MNDKSESKKQDEGLIEVTPQPGVLTFEGKGEKNTSVPQGPSLWLITFTDIMALMLTFFVLMYSMSVPEEEKWEEISDSLIKGFSKFYTPQYYEGAQDAISIEKLDLSDALDLNYLATILDKIIQGDERLQDIVLIPQDDRLIISLPQDLLFEAGKDEVGIRGQKALFALGGVMERIRNRIEIVGHSDPRPMSDTGEGFNSNWGLSLSRAAQVASILKQVGYERGAIVRGVSSTRYDELPVNMDEEKRLNLSRRVDIIVMSDDGSTRDFLQIGAMP